MTERCFEDEDLRILFDGVTVDAVPEGRDLVGPAVAWGAGMRRRDRRLAAGAMAGVAAVVTAGVAVLAPGGGAGGGGVGDRSGVGPGRAPTSLSTQHVPTRQRLQQIFEEKQALLDSLRTYLPPGYRITALEGPDQPLRITGPTGTSLMEWGSGTGFSRGTQEQGVFESDHKPTTRNPIGSGTYAVPGGMLMAQSRDAQAQGVFAGANLSDPTKLVFNTTQYDYTPPGAATTFHVSLSELTDDVPWKTGINEDAALHNSLGFNRTGPVLTPEAFAELVTPSAFAHVLGQVARLDQEATELRMQAVVVATPGRAARTDGVAGR